MSKSEQLAAGIILSGLGVVWVALVTSMPILIGVWAIVIGLGFLCYGALESK